MTHMFSDRFSDRLRKFEKVFSAENEAGESGGSLDGCAGSAACPGLG